MAVADEESGGERGARWLLDEHPEVFSGVVAVLNEGGSNRIAGQRLLWWGIEVAQKRPLWLKVSTRGRGGHGSSLNPGSATHRLLAGLTNLLTQPTEYRVSAAAHEYFAAIAEFHGEAFQEVFGDADIETVQRRFAEVIDGSRELILMPGMLAYFHDTYQITSVETSSATINVVPEEASALVDIRLLPDSDVDEVLERLRTSLGSGASIKVLLSSPSTSSSPIDTQIYRALETALGSTAPLVPSLITGTTDSRYFRERGITAYGFSPFLLSGQEARGIHGPNESIPLQKFEHGLEVMGRVVDACLDL
jgi:acetylornithine deacetylase/succinyl-diaminopimelate desuccinylase-like protein